MIIRKHNTCIISWMQCSLGGKEKRVGGKVLVLTVNERMEDLQGIQRGYDL